jgi:hypothetical protein
VTDRGNLQADELVNLARNSQKEAKRNKDLVYAMAGIALISAADPSLNDRLIKVITLGHIIDVVSIHMQLTMPRFQDKDSVWNITLISKDPAKSPLFYQYNFLGYVTCESKRLCCSHAGVIAISSKLNERGSLALCTFLEALIEYHWIRLGDVRKLLTEETDQKKLEKRGALFSLCESFFLIYLLFYRDLISLWHIHVSAYITILACP